MIFIILGSIPFIAYIKFLSGKKNIFYTDTQIKSFIKIIFYSIVILFFYLTIFNKSFSDVSILESFWEDPISYGRWFICK